MGSAFWSSLISAVLVLLFRFNTPASYVDYRPITGSTAATREYLIFFDLLFVLVLASVVLFAVAILIADYVSVLASNGEKKTIFKRIITFFREYKSEIKKITWPGMSTVTKNTIVVLVMCVIVGILIFLLDTGLVWILDSILKLKS
ncbi:MAG: preprotein translocase subunit SecE [Clostridia bacterium]|nr:preprotein translocase subunit SecE [Clostridia bacterium]